MGRLSIHWFERGGILCNNMFYWMDTFYLPGNTIVRACLQSINVFCNYCGAYSTILILKWLCVYISLDSMEANYSLICLFTKRLKMWMTVYMYKYIYIYNTYIWYIYNIYTYIYIWFSDNIPLDNIPPGQNPPGQNPPDISSKTWVSKKKIQNSSVLNYPKTCVSK